MLTTAEHPILWDERTVERLGARKATYQLLVDFVGEEPTLENIVAWRNHGDWEQLSTISEVAYQVCKRLQEVPEGQLYSLYLSIREEYQRLFKLGGVLPVEPCESIYRANEQMLPKSYAPEVREAYANFSLYFKKTEDESDDHIAVELEFMAVMLEKMQNTVMTEERYNRYIAGQSRFVIDHLEHWAVRFGGDLECHSQHPLYTTLGKMLQDFIIKEAVWARTQMM